MADELQRTYREYANRKRNAFRASVNKAYALVLEKYRMESPVSEGETVESYDSSTNQDPREDSVSKNLCLSKSQRQSLIFAFNWIE